jgi:hypothetical protein
MSDVQRPDIEAIPPEGRCCFCKQSRYAPHLESCVQHGKPAQSNNEILLKAVADGATSLLLDVQKDCVELSKLLTAIASAIGHTGSHEALVDAVRGLVAELHVRTYDYGFPTRPPEHRDTPSWDEGFADGWHGRKLKTPYQGSSTLAYHAGHVKGSREAREEIDRTIGIARSTTPEGGKP